MGVNPQPSERKIKYGQEERIKMTRLKTNYCKEIKTSSRKCCIVNNFNEVDMTDNGDEKRKSRRFSK